MNEHQFFYLLILLEFLLSPFVAFFLFRFQAPYGRYFQKEQSGLNAKIGWFLMEIAAAISFAIAFYEGDRASERVPLLFLVIWQIHYLDRAIFYPLRQPPTTKSMPIYILLMGFIFNTANGYLNGRYLSFFGPAYSIEWLSDPRFICGIFLLISGFAINRASDEILLNLRKPGETAYKIPNGFLYRYISCPNYLGEVIEWFGWALATWSLPGLAFALFTASNLIPRAYSHHSWYQNHFENYPKNRKAIIPFIF